MKHEMGKFGRTQPSGNGRFGMALMELVMVVGLTMVVCSALYSFLVPAMVAFHRIARTIAGWPF